MPEKPQPPAPKPTPAPPPSPQPRTDVPDKRSYAMVAMLTDMIWERVASDVSVHQRPLTIAPAAAGATLVRRPPGDYSGTELTRGYLPSHSLGVLNCLQASLS